MGKNKENKLAVDDIESYDRKQSFGGVAPLVIFFLLVLITLFLWVQTAKLADREAEIQFNSSVNETVSQVENRLEDYVNLLYNLRAFFLANGNVDRSEWETYVSTLDIESRLPGIQAIEFISRVSKDERETFINNVRSDKSSSYLGFPEFTIKPESDNEEYLVVNYIVPHKGNEAAFGFDLATNPARKEALDQARDSGDPIATAPITLVQETSEQSGFLIMLPLYEKTSSLNTSLERNEALIGYALVVFRAGDLFEAALNEISSFENMHIKVVDTGVEIGGHNMLYEHENLKLDDANKFSNSALIDVGGREWKLTFADLPGFTSSTQNNTLSLIVLFGGILIASLVGGLLLSFSNTRRKAIQLANSMTSDLITAKKESEEGRKLAESSKSKIEEALEESKQSKNDLELINESMVGRELKMVELKKEILKLKQSSD